jgi:hypothetical protein
MSWFGAIRLCGEGALASGRAALLAMVAQGDAAGSRRCSMDRSMVRPRSSHTKTIAEAGVAPRWMIGQLEASGPASNRRRCWTGHPPPDIRANRLKTRERWLRNFRC